MIGRMQDLVQEIAMLNDEYIRNLKPLLEEMNRVILSNAAVTGGSERQFDRGFTQAYGINQVPIPLDNVDSPRRAPLTADELYATPPMRGGRSSSSRASATPSTPFSLHDLVNEAPHTVYSQRSQEYREILMHIPSDPRRCDWSPSETLEITRCMRDNENVDDVCARFSGRKSVKQVINKLKNLRQLRNIR